MTDQIDQIADTEFDEIQDADAGAGRRRRMFLTGAGIAGAAAIVGKSGVASAANGESVNAGENVDSTLTTSITNTGTSTDRSNNAFKGIISDTGNNSHTILGTTVGGGHAIAGVVGTESAFPTDAVAATWGRQYGLAAATEGQNLNDDAPIAGDANGVKGIIESPNNGSHSVLGLTNGLGHAVAGVVPAMVPESLGSTTMIPNPNAVAATWGRHFGAGPGAEGDNRATDIELAGDAVGVLGFVAHPTNGSHAVKGVTNGAGHSVAGDTPAMIPDVSEGAEADAMVPNPNTTAATWGRHGGVGAGIGGVSAAGYGGEFIGGKAHVRLIQVDNADLQDGETATSGAPTDEDHKLGELYADGDGKLFYNTANGANFAQLTAQVLFDDPQRAWDSRPGEAPANGNKGKVNAGGTVTIDLTEFTDVPAGASGVILNLSVAETDGIGFATLFNGDTPDTDRPLAAALAWSGVGTRASNSLTARPNSSGQIKVYVGENATHVVIDVSGYIV